MISLILLRKHEHKVTFLRTEEKDFAGKFFIFNLKQLFRDEDEDSMNCFI